MSCSLPSKNVRLGPGGWRGGGGVVAAEGRVAPARVVQQSFCKFVCSHVVSLFQVCAESGRGATAGPGSAAALSGCLPDSRPRRLQISVLHAEVGPRLQLPLLVPLQQNHLDQPLARGPDELRSEKEHDCVKGGASFRHPPRRTAEIVSAAGTNSIRSAGPTTPGDLRVYKAQGVSSETSPKQSPPTL